MTEKRKEILEKTIKRLGGVRQYVNSLRRSVIADRKSGLLRAEGTSSRKCNEMLKSFDELEIKLEKMFPQLVTK